MSIHHSGPDMSGADETTLYLLEMSSSLNLRAGDTQVFPLHVLNNSAELSYNKVFLPNQNKDGNQDQLEVLIDACQEPAVKFVAVQMENSCQQADCVTQQLCTPSLEVSVKMGSVAVSHSSDQLLNLACKKQIQNYVHISDRSILPRAIAVLPTVLQIRQKDIISARRTLLPRTRFGPVQGVKHKMSLEATNVLLRAADTNKRPIFIIRDNNEHIVHIDVSDKDKANWISLLPLGDENSANLWLYEENSELYAITTEAIPSRKQLMLGYCKKYAQDYGLVGPTKEIETGFPLNPKTLQCYECQLAMASAYQLQRHLNAHHQAGKRLIRRRPYRCRYCTRTFSRIFTLRRHVARYCEKKPAKRENKVNTETLPETILNSSLNSEDNRVPSDESFQNFSNGLDFSTNLFDTDRMPSLDISGNSRSEVFNPYGLGSEISLVNDVDYTNGSQNKVDVSSTDDDEKNRQIKKTETLRESCPYCNQKIARGKKRLHLSECTARTFECECKKTFPSKELLGLHVYSEHSSKPEAEQHEQKDDYNTTNSEVPDNKTYLCEQCQLTFKRRGMLVNHLWRVHNTSSALVPLQRRVRHFPCGACPKLYRTAAKRRRHVAAHHPGAENVRAKEIEGALRAFSPAACTECPREYATRAKLLQHQRQHHPHLMQTAPKKTNLTPQSNETSERIAASEEQLRNKTSLQQLLNFY